jgi:alpha-tubulin suppressor-like RCC1 family protein
MPYKISGTKSETARIMILKESDWSIESNTVISGSGVYEVDGLETGTKTTLARTEDGEFIGFGSVTPIESGEAVVPKELWTWGRNSQGQLGDGTTVDKSSPEQVGILTDWEDVNAGADYGDTTVGVKTDGTLWACGENSFGQLGLGHISPNKYSSPVQVGALEDWSDAGGVGAQITAVIKTDGTLWTWGNNYKGPLGLGDQAPRSSPVQVGTDKDWSEVSGGNVYILALKTNGKLYSWGDNFYGTLGLGDQVNRSSPVQVGTDVNWSRVSAGRSSSAAIKTNGKLYSWGDNFNGQLGYGATTSGHWAPEQVGTDEDWSEVEMSGTHMTAIKTDGTLWTCGVNYIGQLGLGNTANRSAPVQVGIDVDWSSAAAGYGHTAALKTGGTLWAWGDGGHGQLGDGTNADKSSPVQVGTDEDWSTVDCGRNFTVALKIA